MSEHIGHPATGPQAHPRPDERGTVLIVDDDASMLRACERLLAQEGFRTVATGDPGRVLEFTESAGIDVALVDVRMPEIDGLALLRILRSKRPDLVVILMTAHADAGRRRSGKPSRFRRRSHARVQTPRRKWLVSAQQHRQ